MWPSGRMASACSHMGYRWCRVRKGRKGEEGREKKREERENIRICCRIVRRAAQCSTVQHSKRERERQRETERETERVKETDRDCSHIPVPI